MAKETKNRLVGGYRVDVTTHGARPAARLLAKVGRLIIPALARLDPQQVLRTKIDPAKLAAGEVEVKFEDVDLTAIVPSIEALLLGLNDQAVDALIEETLKHTTIAMPDDKAAAPRIRDLSSADEIDDAFCGNLLLMFKVMAYAFEVNFGPFPGEKGWLVALVRAAAAASSISSSPPSSESSGTRSS